MKHVTRIIALIAVIYLLSFTIGHFKPSIPKVWDIEQLQSMHLPYADTSIKLGFITEDEYNKLPERVSYKSYPFYMPGSEPPGYYDSLSKLDPIINFREEDLKTEADWIKAGELIYELPMNFTPLDSQMLSLLPVLAARWRDAGIHGNKKGIIPFAVISIRKKGKPELGTESCSMCHTKQMPDDRLFKGGQGNFPSDLFRNIMAITHPNWLNTSPETRLKRFHDFNKRLYYTPCDHSFQYAEEW